MSSTGELTPCAIECIKKSGRQHHLVRFSGYGSRDQAAVLSGAKLVVSRGTLPELVGDEFYVCDLMGLEARCGGQALGTVVGSRDQCGIEIVTVRGPVEELEIPLVEEYVDEMAIDRGFVAFRNIADLPRSRLSSGNRVSG